MANTPILTPEQAEELIRRYQAGDKVNDLAKDYGVTRFSISARLKRAGVRKMRRAASDFRQLTVTIETELYNYLRDRHPNPSILISKLIRHIMSRDTGYKPESSEETN